MKNKRAASIISSILCVAMIMTLTPIEAFATGYQAISQVQTLSSISGNEGENPVETAPLAPVTISEGTVSGAPTVSNPDVAEETVSAAEVVDIANLEDTVSEDTVSEDTLENQIEPNILPAQTTLQAKNINLNVSNNIAGIGNPTNGDTVNSWTGTTVYYGDSAYYVLDRNGGLGGHSSLAGHMLLFSKGVLEASGRPFDDTDPVTSNWSKSDIRTDLNGSGFYTKAGVFTDLEKGAISENSINDSNTSDYFDYYPGTKPYTNFPSGSNDKIFLLDLHDVQNTCYGFSSLRFTSGTRVTGLNCQIRWWLRSPGEHYDEAANVIENGSVDLKGWYVRNVDIYGARPAFNLNLSSVLFSSASGASKSDFGTVSADSVSANTWKLTLKDTDESFNATLPTTANIGQAMTVMVDTPGEGTVSYNQTSAMLVDNNDTVVAYGKIGEAKAGSMTFTIPGSVSEGNYKLKVFPEQVNEGTLTDYAGKVVEGNLQVKYPATVTSVTIDPPTASIARGTSQTFTATVSGNNDPAQTATWSVSGNSSAHTSISANGVSSNAVLSIGSDETAATLTITATSTEDTSKSGTATVIIPPTTKDINLNVNNNIAGIGNPTPGTSAANPEDLWAGTTVYYGNSEYYVLDKNGDSRGHSSKTGHMLLLSKDAVGGEVIFNKGEKGLSRWTGSDVETYLNGEEFYNKLNATEKAAISKTAINNDNTDPVPSNKGEFKGFTLNSDNHIFLLDLGDVLDEDYGFSSSDEGSGTRVADLSECKWWWLRSSGSLGTNAICVKEEGNIAYHEPANGGTGTVRPAFNLNLSSVLFSSASGASKSVFGTVSADSVSANTWKLTLNNKDTSFNATLPTTANIGQSVTVLVNTPGSETVSYNQTSAMLVDHTNTVVAYGKIGEAKAGNMTFTISENIAVGNYKLKVFPEQVNGGTLTDYAGKVVEGNLRIKYPGIVTSVTVNPPTVSVTKGTSQTFTVTVTGDNDPAQTATWSVSGNKSAGTSISSNGASSNAVLTVGSDETATTLTITATSTDDKSKSGAATVTVTTPPDFRVSMESVHAYTGKAIKPAVTVYDDKYIMKLNKDYKIAYKNNKNAYDSTKANANASKKPQVIITGIGNYKGTKVIPFTITPKNLADKDVDITENIYKTVNKKVQKPLPTIRWGTKKLIYNKKESKSDYTLTYSAGDYKTAGTYTVTAKGIRNYCGTKTYQIILTNQKLISKASVSITRSMPYTGSEVVPTKLKVRMGSKTLIENTDYTVKCPNKEIGTAYAIITGIGEYAGTKKVAYKITGSKLSSAKITGIEKKEYTGKPIEQTYQVTYGPTNETLKEGTDYTVTYPSDEKRTNVGTVTMIFTGKGAYSGTVKRTFKITPFSLKNNTGDLFKMDPNPFTVKYEKNGAKPDVSVSFNGITMKKGRDYTLSYQYNGAMNDGTGENKPTITIKGCGNFKDSVQQNFVITAGDLQAEGVRMKAKDVVFRDKTNKYKSTPVITDRNGRKLAVNKDYSKKYSYYHHDAQLGTPIGTPISANEIPSAGSTIYVSANGINNYEGSSIGTTYRIVKKSITGAKVKVKEQVYQGDGKAVTITKSDIQSIKIGKTPLKNEDYEILKGTYVNNTKKGTGKVTIRGLRDYGQEKVITFKITQKPIQ